MKNKIKSARAEIELLQQQNRDKAKKIEELARLASNKSYELDDIIDRVDRSKPIFERMMTKVRKKEGQLKVSAERNTTKADRWQKLGKQYMKLHEQGISIIQNHGLLNKFVEPNTNYTDRELPRASIGPQIREFVTGPGIIKPRHNFISHSERLEEEMPEPAASVPQPFKPASLYELLQKKLKGQNKPNTTSNIAESTLHRKICEVSHQLKQEANKIREMRKSLRMYRGPNTVSETRIRQPPQVFRNPEQQPSLKIPKTVSVRQFMQAKQRRLENLRDQTDIATKYNRTKK